MRMHRYRRRPKLWAIVATAAIAGLAATTLTTAYGDEASPSGSSGSSDSSGSSQPTQQNPSWGQSLPPADAPTSRAYDLIVEDNDSGYAPRAGECSQQVHARYWTYGPDGKVYPTWHPPRDPSGCAFGHEHGDDPRVSTLFAGTGWSPFGYTSEVLMETSPERSHRHEDHVGHKVLVVNNGRVIEGDRGQGVYPPNGPTIARCDVLLKIHQGTHSPDAFTNNVHELMYHNRCTYRGSGEAVEARFTALIPFGRPGGFGSTDCPGPMGRFTEVGPAVPADSPSDTRSLGRLITDPGCVAAIENGRPLDPGEGRPFDSFDLHEFWFSDVRVNGPGLNLSIDPLFYVLDPSRYYDPSMPDNLARQVDLCYEGVSGAYCNEVRRATQQTGQRVAWNDPASPFDGALRQYRPGSFTVSNDGPATVYTDAYGQNVSSEPFEGSIEQYFSGSTTTPLYLRGSTKDYSRNPADQVHAPN